MQPSLVLRIEALEVEGQEKRKLGQDPGNGRKGKAGIKEGRSHVLIRTTHVHNQLQEVQTTMFGQTRQPVTTQAHAHCYPKTGPHYLTIYGRAGYSLTQN